MPTENIQALPPSLLVYATRRRLLALLSVSSVAGALLNLGEEAATAARRHHRSSKHKRHKRVPRLVTVRVTFTGSQLIPSDTQSLVQFNEVDYDTNPISFDLATSRCTVPYSGTYTANAQVAWKGATGGQRKVLLVKNDTTIVATGNGIPSKGSILTAANVTLTLRRGETIAVNGLQDSGAPVEVVSAVMSLVLVKR